MFNFLKPTITVSRVSEMCTYTFAEMIYALEDRSVRDRWLITEDSNEVRNMIDDGIIDMFIKSNFQSEEFVKDYRKLDDFQLQLVKMGIIRASINMKTFIEKMINIWDAQAEVRRNTPGMRVSWKFPEFKDYPSQFHGVKMLFMGHLPGN